MPTTCFGGFCVREVRGNGMLEPEETPMEKCLDMALLVTCGDMGAKSVLEALEGLERFTAEDMLWIWPWCLGVRGHGCQKGCGAFWRVSRLAHGRLERQ